MNPTQFALHGLALDEAEYQIKQAAGLPSWAKHFGGALTTSNYPASGANSKPTVPDNGTAKPLAGGAHPYIPNAGLAKMQPLGTAPVNGPKLGTSMQPLGTAPVNGPKLNESMQPAMTSNRGLLDIFRGGERASPSPMPIHQSPASPNSFWQRTDAMIKSQGPAMIAAGKAPGASLMDRIRGTAAQPFHGDAGFIAPFQRPRHVSTGPY